MNSYCLIVHKWKYDSISSTVWDILHWLPIRQWSSSRRVFSCTTACTIYNPAIWPACVSWYLSTQAYDQLHAVISSSQPQKQCYGPHSCAVAGPAMWNQIHCWHHSAMTNGLSLHFVVYSRLNFLPELSIRLFFSTLVGKHNFNYYYYYYYCCSLALLPAYRQSHLVFAVLSAAPLFRSVVLSSCSIRCLALFNW